MMKLFKKNKEANWKKTDDGRKKVCNVVEKFFSSVNEKTELNDVLWCIKNRLNWFEFSNTPNAKILSN